MMQEMVRIVAAALADATIGVAAQLATMPRESGDEASPVPVILDETSDLQTALDQIPDAPGPFLQVAAGSLRETHQLLQHLGDVPAVQTVIAVPSLFLDRHQSGVISQEARSKTQ